MISGTKSAAKVPLSDEQEKILDWVISDSGNLLIQAGAGTGKSHTLLAMLPYLDGKVLMAAYNKSIQLELEGKVAKMRVSNCQVTVKTLHAIGLGAYKYGGGNKTSVIESNKIRLLLDEMAQQMPECSQYENFLKKLVAYAKQAGLGALADMEATSLWSDLVEHYSVDDEINDYTEDLIPRLIEVAGLVYKKSLSICKDELDFDDLLLAPLYYKCNFPKYDWVLLDEVQDLGAIKREIAVQSLKPGGRMVAVGDRFQCIYGWVGSEPDAMDRLKQRMGMKELPLMTTFRCPKVVVKMAQQYVPEYTYRDNAPEGVYRQVWLEPENCVYCGGDVGPEPCKYCNGKKQPGFWDEAYSLGPQDLIICRNNRPIVELGYQLLRKGIACQIEGRDFAGSLIKLCQKWKVRELNALESKLTEYRDKEVKKWLTKKNEERAAAIEDKVETLLALLDAVRQSGKTRVTDLIDKINSMFSDTDPAGKPKVLTLSTIHKQKGRQADRVWMLGRSRYMPSKYAKKDWELFAENVCLPYVMITRACKELVEIHVPAQQKRRQN